MSLVIAGKGTESQKLVEGRPMQVVPFVGTDREGEFASLGVGFLATAEGEDVKGSIWGLAMPHMVLQSWRGMKVLERCVTEIGHGTLCACWYAGGREIHPGDRHYLAELAKQVGGMENFEAIRQEILNSAPAPEELEIMLIAFRHCDVQVDVWEFAREIELGLIHNSPMIDALTRDAESRRQEYERQEAEAKAPLSRKESLSAFFADLGLDYFCDAPFGAYGWDWGHNKLEQMDEMARRDSFSKHLPDGHPLLRTLNGPDADNFGGFEQPHVTSTDGTTYTFSSAKWEEGRFRLKTKIEREGAEPQEGSYTLAELRAMIGELPKRPQGMLATAIAAVKTAIPWLN